MKIRTIDMSYEEVLALPAAGHRRPRKQWKLIRYLMKKISAAELKSVHFKCDRKNMGAVKKGEPCLYLMNHSSFIDLKIASTLIYPKSFHIVCTSDGFVGKEKIMRLMGCIPTRKFVTDVTLVRDMIYVSKKLNSSILMYPEAGYSFDGTATTLPAGLGKCIKMLGIPVVMIITKGAFLRDPLYNCLQLRKIDVSTTMECVLTKEQVALLSEQEINDILKENFGFDHFKDQQKDNILVVEPFRADGLHRVLYKCPHCNTEGMMKGSGITLTCTKCGKEYVLTEQGYMKAQNGEAEFPHIPDWYRWERNCVKEELLNNTYLLDVPVKIGIMKNMKAIYMVGEGRLVHNKEGFHLTGCDNKLDYHQLPSASYSLNSDYFWYEIGDVICIGDSRMLYYCFPQKEDVMVAKTRLAAEELYKICRNATRK
ncbi:MAG TPA: 1-acyl-sn-glycerol-3-phosphate acyltransferase [Lachnospiraceae bacterium]|nr:1-acyl-sn-glycerol-3-phosphate acyltransferase [Lachnospiraceae bacterium]